MGTSAQVKNRTRPFQVKDCALISIATGIRAQTLKEFRDGLLRVPVGSIYHHFWGRLLRPRFDEPEYNNDFASWAYRALHEKALAERLSMIHPSDFPTLDEARQEIVEIVEQRLDETEIPPWSKADNQFLFLTARIVVFDTQVRIPEPSALPSALPHLPTGSIYYHFIDARRRAERGRDDFCAWLSTWGREYGPLVDRICTIDPYFSSLKELRHILSGVARDYFEEARP